MGFCTICGKPLADGEVCTCQQEATQGVYDATQQGADIQGTYTAPAQDVNYQGTYSASQDTTAQATYTAPQDNSDAVPKKAKVKMPKGNGKCPFSPIFDNARDIIDNPLDAGKNYYKKADLKTMIISLSTLAGLYVLTSLFNLLGTVWHVLAVNKRAVKPLLAISGMKYGDYLKMTGTSRGDILRASGITGGTWVQSIFFPIIYMVLMGAAIVGLVFLINSLIVKKQKIEIINIGKFCAAVSLPIGVSLAARFLNGFVHVAWLNGTLFAALYIAGLVVALLEALEIIKELVQDKKQFVLVFLAMVVGIIIADYLIGDLFLGHFFSRFSAMPHLL